MSAAWQWRILFVVPRCNNFGQRNTYIPISKVGTWQRNWRLSSVSERAIIRKEHVAWMCAHRLLDRLNRFRSAAAPVMAAVYCGAK